MKITGIICEYNPFHNGHIFHIEKTKECTKCDVLVCVMSSNFVQRGEPAIIDKWQRAKIAVENGCDIVFELPFIYSTQSASYFAKGAIDCLKLAKVDSLVFGSESNNLEVLKQLLQFNDIHYEDYKKEGISSASAYERIYGKLNANDILGINYLKEIKDSNITPYTIQRTNHYHDEQLKNTISSASAIRKAVKENINIESVTPFKNLSTTFTMENYYPLIKTLLLTIDPSSLSKLFLMDEGIENNLIKNAKVADSYDEFINLSVSKRYTKSKIQRTLIHLLNQSKKETINALPPLNYLRVLAYNNTGKKYLKEIKENVIIASKFNQIPSPYREMELKATHVYAFPLDSDKQKNFIEKELQPPIYINKEDNS